MKVTKEITFDCAHMLSNYEGKCSNLHGHTYRLQVTLDGNVNSNTYMLLDFNELKEVLNETVMNSFDHALIVSGAEIREEAEDELLNWAIKHDKKFFALEFGKTTCENIAPYIKQMISDELFERDIHCTVSVRLWETPTSFAEC